MIYELDEIMNIQLKSRNNGSRRNSMSDSNEETLLASNFPHLSTPTNQTSTTGSAISRTVSYAYFMALEFRGWIKRGFCLKGSTN